MNIFKCLVLCSSFLSMSVMATDFERGHVKPVEDNKNQKIEVFMYSNFDNAQSDKCKVFVENEKTKEKKVFVVPCNNSLKEN